MADCLSSPWSSRPSSSADVLRRRSRQWAEPVCWWHNAACVFRNKLYKWEQVVSDDSLNSVLMFRELKNKTWAEIYWLRSEQKAAPVQSGNWTRLCLKRFNTDPGWCWWVWTRDGCVRFSGVIFILLQFDWSESPKQTCERLIVRFGATSALGAGLNCRISCAVVWKQLVDGGKTVGRAPRETSELPQIWQVWFSWLTRFDHV